MKAKLLFSILFFSSLLLNSQNLVAYYPFNGNANDESGNLNHGTVNGATLTTDRFGNIDSAYNFDGIDDFILCNTQVGPFGNNSRTVSFWAKTDRDPLSTSQQNAVMSYGQWPTGGGRFEVLLNPKCRGLGVDVSTNYITKSFDNSDNDWHFYTVVFDNSISNALSDLQFYADGTLLTSVCNTNGDINLNTLDEQVLNIGRLFYTGQPRYFKGAIDELKIYNKVLTTEEIKNEYQNLVAYYPFNGNANDESGNLNHGTINGATLTTDRFGNTDSAYNFDGTSQYISIPNNSNINIADGESYSISFWLKHNAQNNAKYLISKYKGSFGEPSYAFGTGSNGDSYSWHEFTASNGTESRGNIDLYNNEWHHVTSVFKSGESVAIYVDGILDVLHPTTHTGSITNTRDLTIGCGSNLAQYYNGSIDDIKIYKKALTIEEIKNEAKDLVAYYPFNGNANDESGNENHGTVNGATLTTDRFGNTDSAYEFNGIDNFIQVPNSNSLDISNSDLTISMWLYNDNPLTDSSWKGISKGGYDTHTGYELIFTNNPSNSNGILGLNIGSSGYNVSSFNTYSNQWIMLTGTYENGVRKVYINGIEQTTTPQGGDTLDSSTSDLHIGKRAPLNNFIGFVKGKMDDIRIFNKALTETDILSLYTNNSLNVEKINSTAESNFYISNNTLHFKNTQNLNDIKSIEVYNLLGQQVFKTSKIEEEIKLENTTAGIYIAKVNSENGYQTLKFINR